MRGRGYTPSASPDQHALILTRSKVGQITLEAEKGRFDGLCAEPQMTFRPDSHDPFNPSVIDLVSGLSELNP